MTPPSLGTRSQIAERLRRNVELARQGMPLMQASPVFQRIPVVPGAKHFDNLGIGRR